MHSPPLGTHTARRSLVSAYVVWTGLLLTAYLVWLVALSWRSMRERDDALDSFFLAGKSVRFLPALLTFWATYFSAAALIGGAGYYYLNGIGNFYFASIGYCILAVFTGTVGYRLRELAREHPEVRSPIQLYLKWFRSPGLELLFVVVTLLCLVPYMAAQITGFARLIESSVGLPYVWTAAGALAVIYVYSESGGLKNIIRTDVVQSLATIVGCIGVVVAFLWIGWGFDLTAFFAEVDAVAEPSLLGLPGPQGFYSPIVVLSLAILISLGAVPMAHNAQRFMIVKEERYLRLLMYLFPVLGVFVTVIAGVIGLGGAVLFSGLESGDQVIGRVMTEVPAVIGALATVGIIAATMSTADSILLSVGFIVSEHWYRERPETKAKVVLRLNRWCTLAVAIFAFGASIRPELVTELAFNAFGGMLQLCPVMVAGIYRVRIGKAVAFASCGTGLAFVLLGISGLYGQTALAAIPPYFCGFICALIVVVLGRLLCPSPVETPGPAMV